MKNQNLNACDYGHYTTGEVRLLPTGGGGNVIACHQHFLKELEFRRDRIKDGMPFDLPTWDSLKFYGQE